jgi:hypothetical protein
MKKLLVLLAFCSVTAQAQEIRNPAIDMAGYLKVAFEAAQHREGRRLTEEQFLRMSAEPGTVVLDARILIGYRNVYELGPLVDLKDSKLTFEGR